MNQCPCDSVAVVQSHGAYYPVHLGDELAETYPDQQSYTSLPTRFALPVRVRSGRFSWSLTIDNNRIVAKGSASPAWLERARLAAEMGCASADLLINISGANPLHDGMSR